MEPDIEYARRWMISDEIIESRVQLIAEITLAFYDCDASRVGASSIILAHFIFVFD